MSGTSFKISDESVNSFGFYVLTSGINLEEFRKNPVMLYLHKGDLLPIGRWENVRVENNELYADPVFDTEDEFAAEIARKVEKGFIKGASMGLTNYTLSEDKALMKPDQTRPTVVSCTLYEVSLTALPSNRNALKLASGGRSVCLLDSDAREIDTIVPLIKTESEMKQLLLKLGLAEDSTEAQALAKVEALQTQILDLRGNLKLSFEHLGKATGAITDANRERMIKLADADFELALSFLIPAEKQGDGDDDNKKQPPADTLRLSDLIKELRKPANGDTDEKDYDWYQKNDPIALSTMKEKEPERFKKLLLAYVGTQNVEV
jgi:HK97 family phage prohead protease